MRRSSPCRLNLLGAQPVHAGTGVLRRSELVGLQISDLDSAHRLVSLRAETPKGKTPEDRRLRSHDLCDSDHAPQGNAIS